MATIRGLESPDALHCLTEQGIGVRLGAHVSGEFGATSLAGQNQYHQRRPERP